MTEKLFQSNIYNYLQMSMGIYQDLLLFPDVYGNIPGFGFLRLHSTYRHDLKIYASDEGRVQMTAAAFAKVRQDIQCL